MIACSSKSPEGPARITCDQFFDHVGAVTGFTTKKPYSEAELALCRSKTQEQLRCVLAATTGDALGLCELADTTQRAFATKLLPSLKQAWPGTVDAVAVTVNKKAGCAFFSIAPRGELLADDRALVAFAIRTPEMAGDPDLVMATLVRDAETWRCAETDPAGRCAELAQRCQ